MADDSVLRSSLKEVKDMQEADSPEGEAAKGASESKSQSASSSLLDELLKDSNQEAMREMEEVKAELRGREEAEAEARRIADEERRRRLDEMREQEAKRREEMIAAREARVRQKTGEDLKTEPMAPPSASKTATKWLIPLVAVVALSLGGGVWYILDQQTKDVAAKNKKNAGLDDVAARLAKLANSPDKVGRLQLAAMEIPTRTAELASPFERRNSEIYEEGTGKVAKRRVRRRGMRKRRTKVLKIRKLKLNKM